jgi:uncharacterized protein YndB with AHSA1/START domain
VINQEVTVEIARPAADVYQFVVADYMKNHPRWDARTLRTELTSSDGLKVGATGIEVRKQMGRENTYHFTVTELTDDHVTFDATSGGTKFGATWAVVPAGDGSRLSMNFRLGMGGAMKLFEPMMKGSVRKDMERAGATIKQMVEAGA